MAGKARCCCILFPGIGLGLSLRVKCPARVPLAGQHSLVAVARNVLHLEAVPLTERSTSPTDRVTPSLPPFGGLLETRHAVRHASLWGLSALGLAILEELQEVSVHLLDSPQEFINPNGFGS